MPYTVDASVPYLQKVFSSYWSGTDTACALQKREKKKWLNRKIEKKRKGESVVREEYGATASFGAKGEYEGKEVKGSDDGEDGNGNRHRFWFSALSLS